MRIDVYFHSADQTEFASIKAQLVALAKQGERIMKTLDEVLQKMTEEDTVEDSVIALLTGIKAQLDTILAGGVTPAQQAKIDEIFAKAEASKAKLEAAILANTPAAP